MLQNEVFPKYREYVSELTSCYKYIKTFFNETYVEDLCSLRGYIDESQRNLIKEMEIGYVEMYDTTELQKYPKELGLLTDARDFILNNRFIIPVYAVNGDLVSLIGYYPDKKKYITLPTPFFAKEVMFFNYKQAYELSWEKYDGVVFLVEGIFDCLSLRSIGLPAIATMGSSVSSMKCELLRFFSRVAGIPDADKVGRRALNRYDKKSGWQLPSNAILVKIIGGSLKINKELTLSCKDMDNFVSWYDADSVRETLLSIFDCKEDYVELDLRTDDEKQTQTQDNEELETEIDKEKENRIYGLQ